MSRIQSNLPHDRSSTGALLVAVTLALGLFLSSAASAQIDTYRVLLKNGNTFTSVERPQVAHFDESKIILRSLGGHVIALELEQVEKVESDLEFQGYGVLLNKTTILVGQSANDTQDIEIDPAMALGTGLFAPSPATTFATQPFLTGTQAQTVSGPVTSGAPLEATVYDIPN